MERISLGVVATVIFGFIGYLCYDFISQAVLAGKSPAQYSFSEWTQSYAERGANAARRAQLAARRDGPLRDHLPEAPSGWTRVEWAPEYFNQLSDAKPREVSANEEDIQLAIARQTASKMVSAMGAGSSKSREYKETQRSWVYTQGDKMVILRIVPVDLGMKERAKRTAEALGMTLGKELDERPLVALHRGAAFHGTNPKYREHNYATMKAALGTGELEIVVQTNASDKDVDRLLSRIDYSTLYSMMGDDVESAALERHHALRERLARDTFDTQMAVAEEREFIERRLQAAIRNARGSNRSEVCIEHGGKQHCAWVN